jgi:acyl-CoA thioesterase-2
VLGQALSAASYTVDGRQAHSLHAYFLRAGDVNAPIIYEVDRARDGKSFSNRRVVAIQHGRPILNMAASFQKREEGLDHQADMPDVPEPEGLKDLGELTGKRASAIPEGVRRFLTRERPFEMRPVEGVDLLSASPREPVRHLWLKTVDGLPDNADLHRNLLAYVSDYQLLGTATLPHGIHWEHGNVQMASLDHAMYFHRPFRIDEWLLYSMASPNASGARGLAYGRFFKTDGELIASTGQEGLIRIWAQR